jgi:hypothetical protein
MAKAKVAVRPVAAPSKRARRWTLPKGCSVQSFVMRELDGHDDLEIARIVDVKMTDDEKSNVTKLFEMRRHEACRRSLVMVNDRPVNVDGLPYEAFDGWSQRTQVFAFRAFNKLNEVTGDELGKFDEAAEDVDLGPLMAMAAEDDQDSGPATDESIDD